MDDKADERTNEAIERNDEVIKTKLEPEDEKSDAELAVNGPISVEGIADDVVETAING